jgi:cob(I)alamin adenosyltransferase
MTKISHSGDDGTTSLPDGRRVPKHSAVIEVYGRIDELISWIGLLGDLKENTARRNFLISIQQNLMLMLSSLSDEAGRSSVLSGIDCITDVEHETSIMESELPPLNDFVLPGGNLSSSYCHIARCVCRNAERAFVELKSGVHVHDFTGIYLNRLADYLFTLSRKILYDSGNQDNTWTSRQINNS